VARFFFKPTQKQFSGHDLQLLQISLKLVQWFGISILDTHIEIELLG